MKVSRPTTCRLIAIFLVTVVALGAGGPAAVALSLVTTIPVGTYPSWVAVNPLSNFVYVTNYNANGSVSVIDGNTNLVVANIPTGSYPRSVAVNPATNLAYVTNHASNTLSVIDLALNQVQNTVSIPAPWHVTINPTTNRGYVTDTASNEVFVVDLSQTPPAIIDILPTGSSPLDVVVNPLTNMIYVGVGAPTSIFVFNGTNDVRVATISVGDPSAIPDRLALNTQTNRLYASVQLSNEHVSVIDTTTNQEIATVPLGGVPDGINVDEAKNQIFVGDLSTPFLLWQIDGATNTVVDTITAGNTPPLGVGVNSQLCRVYTANATANTVSVIDTSPTFSATQVRSRVAPLAVIRTSSITPRAYLPSVGTGGCM